MQNAVSQAPQAVLQFRDPLDDLRRGGLRLDVGIERDFALDFLDRFGNRGFAVVYGMDDLRNDARKRIGFAMSALYFKKEPGQNGSWPAISRQSFPGFGSWLSSPEHAVLSSRASRAPVRALVSAFPSLQSAAPSGPPWRSHKPPTQFRLRLLARPLHRSARKCRGWCDG